jgi:hypothetical protein
VSFWKKLFGSTATLQSSAEPVNKQTLQVPQVEFQREEHKSHLKQSKIGSLSKAMEKELDDALVTLNECLNLCKTETVFIPPNASSKDKALLLKTEYPNAKQRISAGITNMSSDLEKIGASPETIRSMRTNDTNLLAMCLSLVEGTIKKLDAA